MIKNEELEQYLKQSPEVLHAAVSGDGYHYQLLLVSDLFVDKSRIERQKWVYAKLKEHITTGSLHALTMKTLTKDEWEKDRG